MSGILKVGGSELINDNGGSGSLQWGSGVPSGSIVQVQSTQYGDGNESSVQETMNSHTTYVIQNASSATSGGGVSGLLDVNITPKITGSKIWLQAHVFGEASGDQTHNMVFFFIRSVSSTSTHTKLASGVTSSTNAGHIGITSPTKSYYGDEASTTPEVVNMQYFDTHGVSAGTQITYKVALSTSTTSVSKWYTNRTVSTGNEVGVSSICAIELAP